MASGFLIETQQSGPRGGDKLFGIGWGMASLEHRVGERGAFQAALMLSIDPATVTRRSYPLLFQTGETAFGRPLVDAQHPHDFIMGLGFHYTRQFGGSAIVDWYFAPVGDPALGPSAFPHRASAMELPQATLSHHWQDATHIANEVATVGVAFRRFKVEASGFHGAEPNENRWNIDYGAMDSWSGRVSMFPSRNWLAQVSAGRISRPESHEPGDVIRTTGSLHYTRAVAGGDWSSSLIWGRNHSTSSKHDSDSFLLESVLPFRRGNWVTGRIESVDKDELIPAQEGSYRIGAYTVGYTRDFRIVGGLESGAGVNLTFYTLPKPTQPLYGSNPMGINVFIRLRLKAS